MGTALAVYPFADLVDDFDEATPKVLFNMENVNESSQYDFKDGKNNKKLIKGKCDEKIIKLVKDCGWQDEFRAILPDIHKDKIW